MFGNGGLKVTVSGDWNLLKDWSKLSNEHTILTFDMGSESWFTGEAIRNFEHYVRNSKTVSYIILDSMIKRFIADGVLNDIFPRDEFDIGPLGRRRLQKGLSDYDNYYVATRTVDGMSSRVTFFINKVMPWGLCSGPYYEQQDLHGFHIPMFKSHEDLVADHLEYLSKLKSKGLIVNGVVRTNQEYFDKKLSDIKLGRNQYIENIGYHNIVKNNAHRIAGRKIKPFQKAYRNWKARCEAAAPKIQKAYRNWKAHRESHALCVKLQKEAQVCEEVRMENYIRREITDIFNRVVTVKDIQYKINVLLNERLDMVEGFRNRCTTDPAYQDSLFSEGGTFRNETVNEISFSYYQVPEM